MPQQELFGDFEISRETGYRFNRSQDCGLEKRPARDDADCLRKDVRISPHFSPKQRGGYSKAICNA